MTMLTDTKASLLIGTVIGGLGIFAAFKFVDAENRPLAIGGALVAAFMLAPAFLPVIYGAKPEYQNPYAKTDEK